MSKGGDGQSGGGFDDILKNLGLLQGAADNGVKSTDNLKHSFHEMKQSAGDASQIISGLGRAASEGISADGAMGLLSALKGIAGLSGALGPLALGLGAIATITWKIIEDIRAVNAVELTQFGETIDQAASHVTKLNDIRLDFSNALSGLDEAQAAFAKFSTEADAVFAHIERMNDLQAKIQKTKNENAQKAALLEAGDDPAKIMAAQYKAKTETASAKEEDILNAANEELANARGRSAKAEADLTIKSRELEKVQSELKPLGEEYRKVSKIVSDSGLEQSTLIRNVDEYNKALEAARRRIESLQGTLSGYENTQARSDVGDASLWNKPISETKSELGKQQQLLDALQQLPRLTQAFVDDTNKYDAARQKTEAKIGELKASIDGPLRQSIIEAEKNLAAAQEAARGPQLDLMKEQKDLLKQISDEIKEQNERISGARAAVNAAPSGTDTRLGAESRLQQEIEKQESLKTLYNKISADMDAAGEKLGVAIKAVSVTVATASDESATKLDETAKKSGETIKKKSDEVQAGITAGQDVFVRSATDATGAVTTAIDGMASTVRDFAAQVTARISAEFAVLRADLDFTMQQTARNANDISIVASQVKNAR